MKHLPLIFCILLAACTAPTPTTLPTLLPSRPAATSVWTPTPPPTTTATTILASTPVIAVAPTLRPFEDFVLKAYTNLVATYDTSKWRWYFSSTSSSTGASFENALYSLQLTSCHIQEQGATEIGSPSSPPLKPHQVKLGQITYEVYRFDQPGSELNVAWYVDRHSLERYSYADGFPIFVVSSAADQWQECESEAHKVLETVHVQE